MRLFAFLKALRYTPRTVTRLDCEARERSRMIEDLAGRFSREARERSRAIEQFTLRLDTVEQSAESLRQAHENARSLLDGRIAALQGAIELERGSLPPWWEYNDYVDPSLRTVLASLCRPADIAFDVGANLGAVSSLLSRLTGPTGKVIAFEASPRVLHELSRNLLRGFCQNAYIIHAAVYNVSDQRIELFFNESHVSDSVVIKTPQSATSVRVSTLALDDFVQQSGLVPNLVKLDIEGAEQQALEGMHATLAEHKPHLIVETFPSAMPTVSMLLDCGYRAFECNTLREIECTDDCTPDVTRDLVYVHRSKIEKTFLSRSFVAEPRHVVAADTYRWDSGDRRAACPTLDLPAGMYRFCFRPARSCTTLVVFRITATDRNLAYYQTTVDALARGVQSMVVSLVQDEKIQILFETIDDRLTIPEDLPDIEILEMVYASVNRGTTHTPST